MSSRRVSGKARNQLRIALIAAAGHPIREPFAGGLEAFTWALAAGLRQRGHSVSLFAAKGSDPRLGARDLPIRRFTASSTAAADVSMPAADWLTEHHAYLSLMLDLTQDGQATKADGKFDVVHNNSLHHLPVAMARLVTTPQISRTLAGSRARHVRGPRATPDEGCSHRRPLEIRWPDGWQATQPEPAPRALPDRSWRHDNRRRAVTSGSRPAAMGLVLPRTAAMDR